MEYNEEREKRYANAKMYLEMVMFEMRQTPDNPNDPDAELRVYNGAEALINQLRESQNTSTSDEALHIGSVVSSFKCRKCGSENIKERSGYKVCFDCGEHH